MKQVCYACDNRAASVLSAHGFCDVCEAEFVTTMQRVRCAEKSGVCSSPLSCVQVKRCVQLRAAVTIVNGGDHETSASGDRVVSETVR